MVTIHLNIYAVKAYAAHYLHTSRRWPYIQYQNLELECNIAPFLMLSGALINSFNVGNDGKLLKNVGK